AIAIVGISCRLPGAADPAALWRLLAGGGEAVAATPAERYRLAGTELDADTLAENPGMGRGGFIDGVDRFDAPFFEVSPREADAMDPQQRLALELGWE